MFALNKVFEAWYLEQSDAEKINLKKKMNIADQFVVNGATWFKLTAK